MVVGFVKKECFDGIMAGIAGLKRRVPKITMEAYIDLRLYLYDNHIAEIGFLVLIGLKERTNENGELQ